MDTIAELQLQAYIESEKTYNKLKNMYFNRIHDIVTLFYGPNRYSIEDYSVSDEQVSVTLTDFWEDSNYPTYFDFNVELLIVDKPKLFDEVNHLIKMNQLRKNAIQQAALEYMAKAQKENK